MNSLEASIIEFPKEIVKLRLKKEIPVRIKEYKSLVMIESPVFEIGGVGSNRELAEKDFITNLLKTYEEIKSFPNLRIKQIFDEYIEEVKFLYNQDSCGRHVKEI